MRSQPYFGQKFFQLSFDTSVCVVGNTEQAEGVTRLSCPGKSYLPWLTCTTTPMGKSPNVRSAGGEKPWLGQWPIPRRTENLSSSLNN